jgi:hypothetical protein
MCERASSQCSFYRNTSENKMANQLESGGAASEFDPGGQRPEGKAETGSQRGKERGRNVLMTGFMD